MRRACSNSVNPGNPGNLGNGARENFIDGIPNNRERVPLPPSLEAIVGRLETLARLLHATGNNFTRPDAIHSEIRAMYQDLTCVGPQLEAGYPEVLDSVMASMRDASAKPSLPPSLRLAIFQIVELRASRYNLPPDTASYYTQRSQFANVDELPNSSGELTTSSNHMKNGNSSTSTAIGSSNSGRPFIDEIVIKNSDSGKVMGVNGKRVHVIESLSDSVISFKQPHFNSRTLSLQSSSPNGIRKAKELIEETIRRNRTPSVEFLKSEVEDLDGQNSSSSSSQDDFEFSYSIYLGSDVIRICGNQLSFVQEGKLVLDDYFLQKYPQYFHNSDGVSKESEASQLSESPKLNASKTKHLAKFPANLKGEILKDSGRLKYNREQLLEIGRSTKTTNFSTNVPRFLESLDVSLRNSIEIENVYFKEDNSSEVIQLLATPTLVRGTRKEGRNEVSINIIGDVLNPPTT